MSYVPFSPSLTVATGPISDIEADLLVVSCLQDGSLSGPALEVDNATGGLLKSLMDSGSFKGRGLELEWIYPAPMKTRRILLMGAGKADQFDVTMLRRLASVAVRSARTKRAARVCLALTPRDGVSPESYATAVADGVVTGLADSDLYKERANRRAVSDVSVWAANAGQLDRRPRARPPDR